MIPDLELPEVSNPRGSLDIGDGYLLLTATEVKATQVHDCEAKAIDNYLHSLNPDIDCSCYHCVKQWARVQLPNGQIARSRWKEDRMQINQIWTSRNVKVSRHL